MGKQKRGWVQARKPQRLAHANLLKLRVFRLQCGFSIYDVAEKLGISAIQVSRIERGVADTTVRRLAQFADLYGVPIRDLFSNGTASDNTLSGPLPRRKG